jgi:hypothetical protein
MPHLGAVKNERPDGHLLGLVRHGVDFHLTLAPGSGKAATAMVGRGFRTEPRRSRSGVLKSVSRT